MCWGSLGRSAMTHSRSLWIVFSQVLGVRPLFFGVGLASSFRDFLAGVDGFSLSRWPVHLMRLDLMTSLHGSTWVTLYSSLFV